MSRSFILIIVLVLVAGVAYYFSSSRNFEIPEGETVSVVREVVDPGMSSRELLETDDQLHSIPLGEILSGGPGKDGIPSIDDPQFESVADADRWLDDTDPGIFIDIDGDVRFYPYRVLVWHELVNDEIGGESVVVSYCPLCATAVVFDRTIEGEAVEFGVSGLLWQSNLLMYNRAASEENESLWSQVLGEAVVGVHTGTRLKIVPSDTLRYGDAKELDGGLMVLSQDTGALRDYGRDPYGSYYTSETVGFGASFSDTRLHPKALVYGIEIDDITKAYPFEDLAVGSTRDVVGGTEVVVSKSEAGEISVSLVGGEELPVVRGFWFSWLAVHPDTLLYTSNN